MHDDRDDDAPLEETNEDTTASPSKSESPAPKRNPKATSLMGAAMLGVARAFNFVFQPKDPEQPPIVQEFDRENDDDGPYKLELNADNPQETKIRIKKSKNND